MSSPDPSAPLSSNGRTPGGASGRAPGGGLGLEFQPVVERLKTLRPGDPSGETRDRIWQMVAGGIDQAAGSPAVLAAVRLRELQPSGPTNRQQRRIWSQVQAGLASPRARPARPRLAPGWAMAALAAILLACVVNTTAQAALPGAPLYAVKLGWEQVAWDLTFAPAGRAALAVSLANRRQAEAAALVTAGAAPALVNDTLRSALVYLEAAPLAEATQTITTWQDDLAAWPPAYQGPGEAMLDAWAGQQPVLPPAATATPSATTIAPTASATPPPPSATAAPTFTPPIPTTPAPSATAQPSATRQPSSTPLPLPTNGLPASPTALPTGFSPATDLPSLTATPIVVLPTVGLTPLGGPSATSIVPTLPPLPATGTPILPLPTLPVTLPPTGTPVLPLPTLPVTLPPTATPAPSATPLVVLPTLQVTLPVPLP